MSESYVGEIRMFAGNFAPNGWLLCQGQLVAISDYDTLFNLIGTTYGGDGQSTFGLPNLQGRLAIHQSSGYPLGSAAGVEQVTLTANQLPVHTHPAAANGNTDSGASNSGSNAIFGSPNNAHALYDPGASPTALSTKGINPNSSANQQHSNIKPYLSINFIISLYGIYPSQN